MYYYGRIITMAGLKFSRQIAMEAQSTISVTNFGSFLLKKGVKIAISKYYQTQIMETNKPANFCKTGLRLYAKLFNTFISNMEHYYGRSKNNT